jgi:hypothetical protein
MTKKQLKRRIRSLEHALGVVIEQHNIMVQRVADLEEIVFEVESIEISVPTTTPDRSFN